MQSKDLKFFFKDYQIATQTFNKDTIKDSLNKYFTNDSVIHFCHPFGTFTGLENLLSKCLVPLADSIPDLERRDMIVMAGTTPEGKDWIGTMGNYMGTFLKPYLNIPPTGNLVHMRYHEFFQIEDNKIIQIQSIWDLPELIMQADAWPMAPQLGAFLCTPSPMTSDGLNLNGDGKKDFILGLRSEPVVSLIDGGMNGGPGLPLLALSSENGYFDNSSNLSGIYPGTTNENDCCDINGFPYFISDRGMALGDFDNDGDIDIIIGSMIWAQGHKYGFSIMQFLTNNNGTYVDETEERLFNWSLFSPGTHSMHFYDFNSDGYTDIYAEDAGCNWYGVSGDPIIPDDYLCNGRILINDGEGHFVVIIETNQLNQLDFIRENYPRWAPFPAFSPKLGMTKNKELFWSSIRHDYDKPTEIGGDVIYNGKVDVVTIKLSKKLNTGPNGIDPGERGEPGFNEFYYLLHNNKAKEAVLNGAYANGLEHYIAVGKALGYKINAN